MRVRMKVSVSGTRDGESWPAKGGTIDLPEDEAKNLIAIGVAAEGSDEDEAGPAEENAAAPADEETATPGGRPSTPRKPAPKAAK
ncbi:hypothetical protein ACFVW9_15080 [Streptomyces sp. NPDC058217]|uniref:hypothetical protein n=1 Tax=Streptomyces sp. NPDC058217 TaxID=3346384 RepID=UPI0036E88D7A